MDHLRHFGLSEDPFRDEARVRDFLETRPAREAWMRLERGLRQGRGLGVLSGEPGSGKSMVLRRLLEGLEEEVFEASMLVVLPGVADAGALLVRFAKHLGVEEPAGERQALLAQIYEQLAIVREEGRQAVLLVDDADALGRAGALEELCGLLRLEYEERRLLSLLLAGSPALDGALADAPALAQRVDVRGRLGPLDAEDAGRYLAHRLRRAGGDPQILGPEACEAIHRLGRGLPGLMNRLADNALFEAFLCGRRRVSRADVERAHGDLDLASGHLDLAAAPGERHPRASHEARESPARAGSPRADAQASSDAEPLELVPFVADEDLGDLDSELEAIFEGADDGDPPPPRRSQSARPQGLAGRWLED